MSITLILVYLFAAASAGIIAGLLGGGIGLVLVPAMVWILNSQHVHKSLVMHIAIGTSVTAIVVIGALSSYSHHRKNAISWIFLKKMSLAMLLGTIIGALVAKYLPSNILIFSFGIITALTAVYFFMNNDKIKTINTSAMTINLGAVLIGFLGSMFGVNSFCVPFFQKIGIDIRTAVGTTAVIGTLLALGIAIMYFFIGLYETKNLPKYCIGYINWAACIPIAVGGSLFSLLGAKIAHSIPQKRLELLYVIFLFTIAINMIFTALFT